MLWLAILGAILVFLDNCLGAVALQRGAGQGKKRTAYQISPKPCWVDGVEGTCMFVWECIKSEGYHVGMCVDTFMFGSCCAYNSTVNAVAHGAGAAAGGPGGYYSSAVGNKVSVLYTHPGQQKQRPGSSTTVRPKYTSRRPPSSNQLQSSSSSSSSSLSNPSSSSSSNKHRPATPPPRHSLRPMSTDHHLQQQHASNTIIAAALEDAASSSSSYNSGGGGAGGAGGGGGGGGKPYHQNSNGGGSKPMHTRPGWGSLGTKTGSGNGGGGGSGSVGGWHSTSTEQSFITAHNSGAITKPGVLWQVTTEPGFVTRVKQKPVTSHNGQKVRPTKKPLLPVTAVTKLTTKYYTKSTTTTSSTTSTSTSRPSTSTSTVHPSRRPNPVMSSLMLLSSTLSDNKLSASSSPTSSPVNSLLVTSSESPLSAVTIDSMACGQPSLFPQAQTRIVGGKNAAFGRWPWQVSVRRTSFFGFSSTHRCGGAILNENWIATAGHCVDDLLTSQIRIRVGDYDFSSVQEDLPHVERAVARKVVHPKYNFFTYEYDLALVQLDQPLQFAPHIGPICLPASDDLLIGENATVTGWGRLSEGGTLPSVLQEVQVPILSNDKCKSMFLRAGRHEFIPDIFLCAGHEAGGQDSCQGDSGGPLQVRGHDGRYFLAGIISWGIGCAEANLPGVCTRISKFVPWVLNNVT